MVATKSVMSFVVLGDMASLSCPTPSTISIRQMKGTPYRVAISCPTQNEALLVFKWLCPYSKALLVWQQLQAGVDGRDQVHQSTLMKSCCAYSSSYTTPGMWYFSGTVFRIRLLLFRIYLLSYFILFQGYDPDNDRATTEWSCSRVSSIYVGFAITP